MYVRDVDHPTPQQRQGAPRLASWTQPVLVVLVRGRGAERVLLTCKTSEEWPSTGPQNGYSACYRTGYCYEPGCQDLVTS